MRRYCILLHLMYLIIASSAMGATPTDFALVTFDTSSVVQRVNTTTNTIEAVIGLAHPGFGVAITPDALFAYVSSINFDEIYRINLTTNTVDTTFNLPAGTFPGAITINPSQTQAWIANGGVTPSITVIDIPSNSVVDEFPLPAGNIGQIAFTPDGKYAYVTGRNAQVVYQVDVITHMVVATILITQPDPEGILITPDGKTAYVTSFIGGNTVIPISLPSNTVGTPITVGTSPAQMVITHDGSTIFVTNFGDGTVTPIDVATNTPGTPIPIGTGPSAIAITFDGTKMYIPDFTSAVLASLFIDGTVGPSVPVNPQPRGIATPPFIAAVQNPGGTVTGTNLLDTTLCGIIISWDFDNNSLITAYQIFQNGILIGTVLATASNQFIVYTSVCADLCTSDDTFSIASVTALGVGMLIPVVIQ
jgi:YVTN family beta-propeller protein